VQVPLRLPDRLFIHGFSLNKRRILRRFASDSSICPVHSAAAVPPHSTLLLWGSRAPPQELAPSVQLIRVEDGFLRSVGLGAQLVSPLSWVMDTRGIYYDATRTSDLEHLLQNGGFDAQLLQRAALLRRRIVAAGITKYNVGHRAWQRPRTSKRLLLVPGQVETDASLRFGAPAIRTNMVLLAAVREANPDSYIIYRPHPDVTAGMRARGSAEEQALRWCDEVAPHASMDLLLDGADEVHVLTSLSGFEALLRSKPVTCYGLPFYAGWGLTRDVLSIPRRNRRLSLDELVAGSLLVYPRYVSRSSNRRIGAEQALDELLQWRARLAARPPWWRHLWLPVLRIGCRQR
jgi:capsular polysaccharide export protein